MPRASLCKEQKKEYKVRDIKGWVCHQMKMNGLKQKDVAKALNISQGALSIRLRVKDEKGKSLKNDPFTYGDLLTLCELFKTSDEEKQRLLTM